jgi:DNA-binding response OmpR family regulator
VENIIYKTLVVDQNNKICYVDDNKVILTKKEYAILILLLTNPNYIYTRESIIEKVWNKKVSLRTVDTNIRRLRKKLTKYGSNINTRIGFGYGFDTTIN